MNLIVLLVARVVHVLG